MVGRTIRCVKAKWYRDRKEDNGEKGKSEQRVELAKRYRKHVYDMFDKLDW